MDTASIVVGEAASVGSVVGVEPGSQGAIMQSMADLRYAS